jgi:selenide,water dikinase
VHGTPIIKDLVLVGGGHAHVHVLLSFAMRPMPGVRLTLITRDVETTYSGMLPGFIAGHYTREQCHIDLRPLARLAGARLVHDEAMGLDLAERRVICCNRPPVAYDVLSIDIGSSPLLSSIPGAAEHAMPVKPINRLAERWERIAERVLRSSGTIRFLTVGGGAGGVEVTLAMRHRLRTLLQEQGRNPESVQFKVVTRSGILSGHNRSVQEKFRSVLQNRGVAVLENAVVQAVANGEAICAGGGRIGFDQLIWVTQAGAASWLATTGLQLDKHGFVAVDARLRSSDKYVFAAGDIAANIEYPRPKAGVFAVRQGPPLAANLRRALTDVEPRRFVPQHRFLSLISTGDKRAIASRGSWAAEGPCLWTLKDWIDRRWMRMYQELPEAGPAPAAVSPGASDPLGALWSEPKCCGCGAKVGATTLSRVMARLQPKSNALVEIGLGAPDDAAMVRLPEGKLLLQTVDFFRAFIDDPYLFGRIAANHALDDIYAIGAEPLTALATATIPFAAEEKVEEDLYQMLRGGLDVLEEAGAVLVGGHSTQAAELALGFSINGAVEPGRVLGKSGLRSGDRLILTKPLGTGVLLAAEMRGKARGPWIGGALAQMQQSSREAARCLRDAGARACTGVAGFGLIGQLLEMLRASGMDASLFIEAIPALDGVPDILAAGIGSGLMPENLRLRRAICDFEAAAALPGYPLLFDPQTAGGLLTALPPAEADRCVLALHELGYRHAAVIGEVQAMASAEPRVRILQGRQG